MAHFVELETSVFDPEFTLNPAKYLAPLYEDDDVIGFISHGIKFVFKFEDCKQIMFSKHFSRPSGDDAFNAREMEYAEKYPERAYYFSLDYSHGEPDLKLKSLIVRLVQAVSERASFDIMEPVAAKLKQTGRVDDFISDITYLPLKMHLDVVGLRYTQDDLVALHSAGCDFLKSFEAHEDEAMIALSNESIKAINAFVDKSFAQLTPEDLLYDFIEEGKAAGVAYDKLKANLGNVFLVSLSNTFGISASFILRNLINNPSIVEALRQSPELLTDDAITEILRVDNHVKALARAATEDFTLREHTFNKGEAFFLFFPGLNLDPAKWGAKPSAIDLHRHYAHGDNLVFGGSVHMCIGKKLTFAALRSLISAFVEYMPNNIEIVEDEIVMNGSWLSERIITQMPILIHEETAEAV